MGRHLEQMESIRDLAADLCDVYELAKEELKADSPILPVLEAMEHVGLNSDEAWTLLYEMNLRGVSFTKE